MKMRSYIISLLTLLLFSVSGYAQDSYQIPEKTKKILFLGNSITYAGHYVNFIETYLTLSHPEKKYELINVGLPSETVSGLSEDGHAKGAFPRPDLRERLDRVLAETKPDLVLSCYGMNDGIFQPFNEKRFAKYKKGIKWLHNKITKLGVPVIHLTPPIYDARKGKAYANVLDIYAAWLESFRYTEGWKVIDLHWAMRKHLENKREEDSSFVFANDGVHPNRIGHWIMAREVLLGLGEKDVKTAETAEQAFASFEKGKAVLKLVEKKQKIMKDAWLTHTKHKRPRMAVGLPLEEALAESQKIDNQIMSLLQ